MSSDRQREYARKFYHKIKSDPDKLAKRKDVREKWYNENKQSVLDKQREKKRQRKLESNELDKCDLLCANCHRLTHHNWEVNDLSQ